MIKKIISFVVFIATISILVLLFTTTEPVEFYDPNLKRLILD